LAPKIDKKVCARVSMQTFEQFRQVFPFYGETQAFLEMCIDAALDSTLYNKTIGQVKEEAKEKARSTL
jgi:hypothetical protein